MNKVLFFIIIIIIVVVVVVDDDNYYWVYLPSDHAFEVYSKCDSLFYYKDAMVCYYKVRQNKVEDQEKQLKSGGGGGAFLLIKCERFSGQESVNGNCNNLLHNESGRK